MANNLRINQSVILGILQIIPLTAFMVACSNVNFATTKGGFNAAKASVGIGVNPSCAPDYQPCTPGAGTTPGGETTANTRYGVVGLGFTTIKVAPLGCAAPGSPTTIATQNAMANNCEPYSYTRCTDIPPVDPSTAQQVLGWVEKCSATIPELRTFWHNTHNGADLGPSAQGGIGRQLYPILQSKTDPSWKAPLDATASCTVPGGLKAIDTVCAPGCYTGEQKLRLNASGDEQAIAEAQASGQRSLAVVKEDAQTGRLTLANSEVDYFIASQKDAEEEIYVIKTGGGRLLRLTSLHPLVGADGEIHLASSIKEGDELLRADGGVDRVIAVAKDTYFGKVHNVAPKLGGASGSGDLVVSEGLVQGSHRHQLDATVLVGRKLLRNRLTQGLFE